MTKDDHNWDEDERFETLFSAANHDTPPPDAEFLRRLRTRSTEVFLDQFPSPEKPEAAQRRSRKMFLLPPRAWAAVAAAVVLFASWFTRQTGEEPDKTLAVALTRLTAAESLHLTLVRAGQASDVWVARPNRLRWERPDGTYQIDDGQQLWDINERENQAVPRASQFFRGDTAQLDVLGLLDVGKPEDEAAVLAQRPAEQVTEDGVLCDVYQWTAQSGEETLQVQAIVDTSDQMLRSLRTFVLREGRLVPVNKLVVKDVNPPVAESLFTIAPTLTVDGRIGTVADCQGLVSVKPVAHARWTPIARQTVLKPRDWIRTDLRGAHAATLRLGTSIRVTLGPGTLVELESPQRVKLVSGELKVVTDPEQPLTLIGPDKAATTVQGTGIYRVDQDKLVALQVPPGWIAGFEGTSTQEAIGSLVARIDGRDVPLTVGFHTVTVDIRDQIARTVIDESFVNHTPAQLEGVFYFPLPADASISGFGMWIGDEYVEADIVEKQRAREIYETILREKRDPGLLEWTGGNVFKARVFPILGHAEKRVRISYTQVLPRVGNRYRYSYALQSELLRQHPLRALGIDVQISSAVPITAVTSPTHTTRIDQTQNSARVEFAAQEYTPTRDFEVVVELGQSQSDIVWIPHQRGEDGYFMLQVQPPGATAAESAARDVLPDGAPLKLVLLADTSRSMDAASRQAQSAFVAALTASLSPQDQFNLGTCDVDCQWAFDNLVPAEEGNIQTARKLLDERASLGWTDLDQAFAAALKQAGSDGQVIYIGDGIVTTGDADAVEFTKRLQRLYAGHQAKLHAVATSSRYEVAVFKSLASLGDGSLHRITGELDPVAVARQLLSELAQPSTRILKVEFPGLLTARVYPQDFPRLPAGAQQIILGRYLPQAGQTDCEAVVTAQRGGRTFEMRAPVSLQEAADGNSFIPRLWARMHLDALLEQGSSPAVQDEIIALSEEYHIITPYTSLLVLETDADRARFKVQRRFQMRDGERFFASGRQQVDDDLLQQQMRQAGDWRIRLRMAVLRELSTLGREAAQERYGWLETNRRFAGGRFGRGEGMQGQGVANVNAFVQGGAAVWHFGYSADPSRGQPLYAPMGGSGPWGVEYARLNEGPPLLMGPTPRLEELFAVGFQRDNEYPADAGHPDFEMDFDALGTGASSRQQLLTNAYDVTLLAKAHLAVDDSSSVVSLGVAPTVLFAAGDYVVGKRVYETRRAGTPVRMFVTSSPRWAEEQGSMPPWLGVLFPHLPTAPPQSTPAALATDWPAEVRAIAESLLRTGQLAAIRAGLEITRDIDYYQPRWGTLTSQQSSTALIAPERWLVCTIGDNTQTVVHTCDAQQRAAYSRAFQLGRSRAATPQDLKHPPLDLAGYMLTSLEQSYSTYVPSLERQGDNAVVLSLTHPLNEDSLFRFVIDTEKHVVLSMESREGDEVTSAQKFGAFVEWSGAWWPTQIESFDGQGRRVSSIAQRFQLLDNDTFAARMQELQAGREDVQFAREPLPDTLAAQKSVDDGKETCEDHLAMLAQLYAIQKWDSVLRHLEALEALANGKPGMCWIRDAVLIDTRGREGARQRIIERAAELAQAPAAEAGPDRFVLAQHLWSQASNVFEANELLTLLDTLQPVVDAQPPHLQAPRQWQQYRINCLSQTGREGEAFKLKKQLAGDYPHDAGVQQQYAQALVQIRDFAAAKAWLDGVLSGDAQWDTGEIESLRNVITQMYREQDRYEDLAVYLADWVAANPQGPTAYQQYLSALIKSDQIEHATQLADQWLEEGLREGQLSKPAAARLTAAVQLALGEGYELRTERLDPRWWEPLAELVAAHARRDTQTDCISQIMSNGRFAETQQYQRVRRELMHQLPDAVAVARITHLQRRVDWVWDCDVATDVWSAVADRLRQRWDAETQQERRHAWGGLLARVLQGKIGTDEYLQFLRVQLEQGPQRYRTSYAGALLDALLRGAWSAEREDEAFALLPRLSDADDAYDRLAPQVAALQRLTDSIVQSRFQALMDQVPNQSQLTRTELRDKQLENMKQARTQYAERLKERMRSASELLVPWMNAEWTYLQVLLNENLGEVAERCWEALGTAPPQVDTGTALGDALQAKVLERFLVTVTNLAARRDASPELVARLMAYLDQGIAARDATSDAWKQHKFRLLVALDRSDELAATLREWLQTQDAMAGTWQIALAYLLAEQGHVAEAIASFEKLRAKDQLAAADLQALADWYLVLDKRDEYQQARKARFEQTEESQLRDALTGQVDRWERLMNQRDVSNPFGGPGPAPTIPDKVDDEALQIFAALFAKSSDPANYLDLLRRYYRATHDFRLLTGLADAVVGQTAGTIYPWLKNAGNVISEVREEATVDSLVTHLPEVRERAKSAVDQRALDLLELMLERRAAELLNQPGPHVQRALKAIERAFKREWSEGEPRLMADYLSHLGRISDSALAAEQARQLESLHQQSSAGTIDRLQIGLSLARLYWSYDRQTDATDLLEATLQEHASAQGGVLPAYTHDVLRTYVLYLDQRGLHVQAERFLLTQIQHPVNAQQAIWLQEQLAEVYENALANAGEVSLGKGVALYRAQVDRLINQLQHEDKNYCRTCIDRLVSVYRTAHSRHIVTARHDLVAFAHERLPQALKRQVNEYQRIVGTVADTIKDVAGVRAGLAFVIHMFSQEPGWFAYERRDGWQEHAWRLCQWRKEIDERAENVGSLGDLEQPLLTIVTQELRRDLETRRQRNQNIYWQHHDGLFWESQRDAFLRTAETVRAQYQSSPPTVKYVAEYVAVGLENYTRGIEMLQVALQDGTLDEDGRDKLVTWLHHEDRYAESVPLLQEMVEQWPDNMNYRVYLMRAYFQTTRSAELSALVKQTDAYFHEKKQWNEATIAPLSAACLDCGLLEQAVDYYQELIPLCKRTHPNAGIGDGVLSGYCGQLARAYAGLGKTAEAVDAACEAIVSWGPQQAQRQEAFKALTQVLHEAEQLGPYVESLDQEAEKTGSDKPIVRKALGSAFARKQQWASAITQFKLAIQLQPNDLETSSQLIECYDALGDRQAAIDQMLAALETNPRDITLCKQLGERYSDLGRAANAERAYTSIIELLPNEAEGHALLAQIREAQDRWPDAAEHWQQVAQIRRLEPTGLLRLAGAQIHLQQWDAALETIARLQSQSWPDRFGNVQAEIRELEAKVRDRR